ncbi:MAG: T9SS type A sorting domain-containing protein [Crocinitomicaceae bacterium]|nr:T9SS type A sorting domain-containing protein [Flavobacteriales bacterium]NQZ38250.1 T9SS type A sorting domain-containing protein [Crocinitomicaceae bacterium]
MFKLKSVFKTVLFLFFFVIGSSHAQQVDIIENGDVEDGPVPTGAMQIDSATGWSDGCGFWDLGGGTVWPWWSSDLLDVNSNGTTYPPGNNVFGPGAPHSGDRFLHFLGCDNDPNPDQYSSEDYHEAVKATILEPLVPFCEYTVGVWVASHRLNGTTPDCLIEIVLRKGNCNVLNQKILYTGVVNQNSWTHLQATFTLTQAEADDGYDRVEIRRKISDVGVPTFYTSVFVDDLYLLRDQLDAEIEAPSVICDGDDLIVDGTNSIGEDGYSWYIAELDEFGTPLANPSWTGSYNGEAGVFNFSNYVNFLTEGKCYLIRLAMSDCFTPWEADYKIVCIGESFDLDLGEDIVHCAGSPIESSQIGVDFVDGYTYSWTTPSVTSTESFVDAFEPGEYCLTVISGMGCVDSDCLYVVYGEEIMVAGNTTQGCPGATVTICPYAIGGPYHYDWGNGPTNVACSTVVIPFSGSVTYPVSVSDNSGCFVLVDLIVEAIPVPQVHIDPYIQVCAGDPVVLSASTNGQVSFMEWTDNTGVVGTGSPITVYPTVPTTYTVTVYNNPNCVSTAVITVYPIQGPQTYAQTTVLCINDPSVPFFDMDFGSYQNGNLTVVGLDSDAQAGIDQYMSYWPSTMNFAFDPSDAGPGTHTIKVCDNKKYGCCTYVTFTVCDLPSVSISDDDVCDVFSPLTAIVNNASSVCWPSYSWTGPSNNGATTSSILPTAPGTYTVTVTTVGNCTTTATIQVAFPLDMDPIVMLSDIPCVGSNDPITLLATPPTSTGSYTYAWDIDNDGQFDDAFGVTTTFSGFQDVCVEVTDVNGCTAIECITINYMAAPVILGAVPITLCEGQGAKVCLTTDNSCSSTTWQWFAGITPIPGATGSCFNFGGGAYPVGTVISVEACCGTCCSSLDVFTIVSGLTASSLVTDVLCNGDCNGSIVTTPIGNSPFTFSWNTTTATTQNLNNLCEGSYQQTITDANGCSTQITSLINEPAPMSISSTDAWDCSLPCGGSIDAMVTGGVAPYSYNWNNNSEPDASSINGLCDGTYNLVVTDANGCQISTSVTLTPITIFADAGDDISICVNMNLPNGQFIGGLPSGPAGATYLWSSNTVDVSLYLNDITSAYPLYNLQLGVHTLTLTVTSADGSCSITDDVVVSFGIAYADAGTSISICHESGDGIPSNILPTLGGAPSGPVGANYVWTSIPASGIAYLDNVNSPNPVYDVQPGAYIFILTVVDPLTGCTATDQMTYTYSNMEIDFSMVGCANDCSIDITAIVLGGGTPPYQYNWTSPIISNSQTIYNQCTASGTVEITDNYGCTATHQFSMNSVDQFLANSSDYTVCPGDVITLGVAAIGPFINYVWTPAAGLSNPNNPNTTVTPLVTTTYTVTAEKLGFGGVTCYYSATVTIDVSNEYCPQGMVIGTPTDLNNGANSNTQINESSSFNNWSLTVSPNPTNGRTTISISGAEDRTEKQLKLVNLSGQVILERTINANNVELDLSDYEQGTYLIYITDESQSVFTRLIKID